MASATVTIRRLRGIDWSGQKMVEINGDGIPPDTTIGEVVAEMIRAMNLPPNTPYAAYYKDRKLNRAETVEAVGLETDAEITISPEVTAGER
jgi:hypothetical protein